MSTIWLLGLLSSLAHSIPVPSSVTLCLEIIFSHTLKIFHLMPFECLLQCMSGSELQREPPCGMEDCLNRIKCLRSASQLDFQLLVGWDFLTSVNWAFTETREAWRNWKCRSLNIYIYMCTYMIFRCHWWELTISQELSLHWGTQINLEI